MVSDFLRVFDRSGEELVDLIELAIDVETRFRQRSDSRPLAGYRVAMWWDGEGFRNRAAFELGASFLGANSVEIPGAVGDREDIADIGAYLGNWFDAIVVRTPSFRSLASLAAATPAMVINARTSHNHPCEILGDLAFLHATDHDITDITNVVFVGEASNLCHSWFEAAAVLPIAVTQVCPPGYEVDIARWHELVPTLVGTVVVAHGLDGLLQSADVVYTDCWPSGVDVETRQQFHDLQITAMVLDQCRPTTKFLPCPPVSRGEEISADAMTHPTLCVVDAKRWLLHAQNALLIEGLTRRDKHDETG